VRHAFTEGTLAAVGALLLVLALSAPARATDHSHHTHSMQESTDALPGTVRITLPDSVLIDQDGESLKFGADAVAGRLVAINFIYTTCTTVCPVQSAVFADVQRRLANRAGSEVFLLSVTVDPLRDTPAVLGQFASRYQAGPRWRFLTGSSQAVQEVLKAFDVYTPNFADHPAAIVVGDPRTGEWVRFLGFVSSDEVVKRLEALQAARAAARSSQAG